MVTISMFMLLFNKPFRKFVVVCPTKEPSYNISSIFIFLITFATALLFKKAEVISSIEQLIPSAAIAGAAVILYNLGVQIAIMLRRGKKDIRWVVYCWKNIAFISLAVITGILITLNAPAENLIIVGALSFFFCMVK